MPVITNSDLVRYRGVFRSLLKTSTVLPMVSPVSLITDCSTTHSKGFSGRRPSMSSGVLILVVSERTLILVILSGEKILASVLKTPSASSTELHASIASISSAVMRYDE